MQLGVREDLAGGVENSVSVLSSRFDIQKLVIAPFGSNWRDWDSMHDRVVTQVSDASGYK